MQFSDKYLALLKEFEGFFANPYLCPTGHCTIGYGTNLEAHRKFIPYEDLRKSKMVGRPLCDALKKRGMVWTREQATEAMLDELRGTHNALMQRCSAYVALLNKGEEVRANALLDMAYNMGVASLLTFKNTLPKIEHGNYEAGAAGMRASKWFRQVGRRSRAVCSMMETGRYPESLK